MIEVKNLHKSFDGKKILEDISAQFLSGKVNQIIGQSGSGKTVLMKSIIGLFRPEEGQVLYDGRNLVDMSGREVKRLRQEVGMLFQGSALFDSLTVLGNVMFPLEMFAKMTRKEMEERAKFCLTRVNLMPEKFGLYPGEISGGMQKRVAIARAIALALDDAILNGTGCKYSTLKSGSLEFKVAVTTCLEFLYLRC